ncbi:G-patch domain and KOW motifs-containing protein [Apis laboriosa]|uniref:G-patch domain and KOW motifs-containing protein n=1 Tax=Apis laboriosa TaxID=183418 RepID=UPI001CC5C2E5|nr:G-patch domain and KOW motifs-containing protein [Apis laboriosa]
MAEEGKKVSFGFAKSIKKPVLKNIVPQEEKKVDYIECLDEKNIKVIGEEEKKDEPLVIPLLGSKTWHDRIINHIDADIFEPKENKEKTEDVNINKEVKSKLSNGNASPQIITKELEQLVDNKVVTLEEQAAKEIIEELKLKEQQETKTNDFTLPLVEDQSLRGQEQSTLEDYERIPVDVYGFAMLRGMGWQPGKGIGRNEKVVSAVIPELRPKGMGLGADKVTQQKNTDSNKQEEELKIEKGTFVKIIAGKQSNNYGQIEGFDDDAGRLIIKLALGGSIISVNEFMVQPVTKSEYSKNSKVLNAKKYEEYKDKESKEFKQKTDRKRKSISSEKSENLDDDENNEKKKKSITHDKKKYDKITDKKSKSQKRYSESDVNDSDHGKKRRREKSSSISSDSYKSKKSKKSKKQKKHYSPERSNKKHKKKDKEKEKTREKKDYTDRWKQKKRKRSRSRSSSRR